MLRLGQDDLYSGSKGIQTENDWIAIDSSILPLVKRASVPDKYEGTKIVLICLK